MEKFIAGAVVGFFLSRWLTSQQGTNSPKIHWLKQERLPASGGTAMSGPKGHYRKNWVV